MVGVAWPDASQHIFRLRPNPQSGFNEIVETYWTKEAGWQTRVISAAPTVPGGAPITVPPAITEPAAFVGEDGPHVVFGGLEVEDDTQQLGFFYDLWWAAGQWNLLRLSDSLGYPLAMGGSTVAYGTTNGQSHALFTSAVAITPGEEPGLNGVFYLSWKNNGDGTLSDLYQNLAEDMAEASGSGLNAPGPTAAIVGYATADGNEWVFWAEAGVLADAPYWENTGRLWAINIRENAVVSATSVLGAEPRVGFASGLAGYQILTRTPPIILDDFPPYTHHVFFTDSDQDVWEAASSDGIHFTTTNLSKTSGGAEPAWLSGAVETGEGATPLAAFVTFTMPRFPFRSPVWWLFPILTQWVFYVGQDDELHYISVSQQDISEGSLANVNGNAPDLPPRLLDAYTSPDGTWHVDYAGDGQIQEVYWSDTHAFPNTLGPL